MKKTILLIDNSLYITGSIKSTLQITRQLKDKYDFIFVLPSHSAIISLVEDSGFEVVRLPMLELSRSWKVLIYLPMLALNALRLDRMIRSRKVDVLHTNDIYNMLGVALRILHPRLKIVYCVRLLSNSYIAAAYAGFAFFVKRAADHIICVSEAVRHDIGRPEQSVVVYHNLVVEKLDAWTGLREPERLEILYLGNFIQGKGQEWAIRAMEIVLKKYPEVKLNLVGDCNTLSDLQVRDKLLRLCRDLGLSKSVRFKGPSEAVEQTMKNSDLVLNLSESESFSMVCLEAISFGVPLITSDSGGPAEITDQGRQAVLVPNKDFREAARAIIQVIENPEASIRRAMNAKIYAREKFDPERERSAWERIYN